MTSPEASRTLTATVLRGVGFAGIGYVLSQLLTLVSYLALARLITPAEFGRFAAGSILIGVGAFFAESGMPAAVVQRKDRLPEAVSTAFVATMLAGLAMSLIALAAAPLLGLFFHSRSVGAIAAALAGYFVFRQARVIPGALMQRRFSLVRRAVVEPAAVVVFGATSIVACAYGMGAWGLVLGTYAAVVIEVILSWGLVSWRPQWNLVSFQMWRELMRFGRPVFTGELIRRANQEMGTAIVGRFLGARSLGQFGYASRVAGRPFDALVSTTGYMLFPAFARIAHDGPRFRWAFLRALRWTCAVSFPASLMLFALGKPAVVVVFGERWHDAGVAVMAMSLFTAGHSFDSLATEVFKAAGRPAFFVRMQVISLILTAVLMLALLPFGLIGVAAALSIRALGVAAFAVRATGRVVDVSTRSMLAEIWAPAVAALALGGVVFPLDEFVVHADSHGTLAALGLLTAEGMLGVVVYVGVFAAAAPDTARGLFNAIRTAASSARRGRGRGRVRGGGGAAEYLDS